MQRHIRLVFLASFLFSLHMALLAYVNSSMLAEFASAGLISIAYTLSSILSIFIVSIAPRFLKGFGNLKYMSIVLILSALLLYMISSHIGISILPFFILYFALNSAVLYGLDIFLEHYSKESSTGNTRGLYLTLGNIGWVLAPLISSRLEEKFGFPAIYIAACLIVLLTFLVVLFGQRGVVDKAYKKSHFLDGLHILRKNKK